MDISVIIATYNRSESLRLALQSFEEMAVPPELSWELIIVDNNSNDNTKELCNKFQQRNNLPLRYIFERRQGKPFALNRGIGEAKGEILAFTDDDAIVDTHWLTSISKAFSTDMSISGIGGRVEPFNENTITFRTCKERTLLSSPYQLYNPLIIGVNMAFRRNVIEEVGDMDPQFGPGTKIGTCIDLDFIYRVYKSGFKLVYLPDVCVYHNQLLRTQKDIQSLNQRYMIGRGAFYCKYIIRGDIKISLMAFREIYIILKKIINNLLKGKPIKFNISCLCNLMTGAIYKVTDLGSFKVK